ncbi:MAG: thioredoxin domain-containing protein [Planctomycetota bacterium]|jgi:hypothetical protein
MWSVRQVVFIGSLIFAFVVPICSAKAARGTAKKRRPQVLELLDKYASTQDKYQSFIVRAEQKSNGTAVMPDGSQADLTSGATLEFRFDGERINHRRDIFIHNQRSYGSSLWDGNSWYDTARGEGKPGRVIISKRSPKREKTNLSREGTVSPWLGYFYGDDERIDTILREAIKSGRSVSLQDTMQAIGGSNCHVITATTKWGKYTVWLDPNKDYNIVKAITKKGTGDSYLDKPPYKEGESSYYKLHYIQYKKQGDVWVPKKAKWQIKAKGLQGFFESVTECNFTEVSLDPDHEALGSFALDDVMNGATVSFLDAWDIKYTWQDGHLVDAQGFKVSLDPNQPGYLPVLVGKSLPDLKAFNLRLERSQTKDKRILVCFFDMEQRPSRNCVQRLNKKAKVLAGKGVFVVLVHAARAEKGKLEAWLEKRKIALPVGRIEGDVQKVLRAWGVRSLPWLTLTDPKHVVTAEGFGPEELDDKIE